MDRERNLQVVLGEAERTDGLLRCVLEAEGFDVVGLASSDEELLRVLRGPRPGVVVLDGGISATAALQVRDRAGGAALVVVWPDGVSSVIAEERVEPDMVIEELGDAVRRAAGRTDARADPVRRLRPSRGAGRRRGQLLMVAATWLLTVAALATIAAAVPSALGVFSGPGVHRGHPPPVSARDPRPTGWSARVAPAVIEERPATCDERAVQANGAIRSDGRGNGDPRRAHGCPPDRGRGDAGRGKGRGTGDRPVDPGHQAQDGGNGHRTETSTGDDAPAAGGGAEHGIAGGTGHPREGGRDA